MPVDHHIMNWTWVFEWIHPGWADSVGAQHFFSIPPSVCYDDVYTTLGSLGQIIWDHQLLLDDIILAVTYVCLDLIELISIFIECTAIFDDTQALMKICKRIIIIITH